MDVFHPGERAVQSRLGVLRNADSIGRMIQPYITIPVQYFEQSQPVIVIGSTDAKGCLWASLICGDRGLIRAIDEQTLRICPEHNEYDKLFLNLQQNSNVGIIIIEFDRRTRIRINGLANILNDGTIEVKTEQVYGNCSKYIQARQMKQNNQDACQAPEAIRGIGLNKYQQDWIAQADTFFVSSANESGKTDVSHRGGHSGFVCVLNDATLLYPDYPGNMMFNTLGNVIENPKTGLLFIDFQNGHTLQLTGDSKVIWDLSLEEQKQYPGAQRLIEYTITEVIQIRNVNRYSWNFIDYSPFNP